MDKHPKLSKNITVKDFRDFYWLKEELIEFCRSEGLRRSGGKIELANQIEEYLKTGKISIIKKQKVKTSSNFDWNSENLTLQTLVTDNYKNSKNVRVFFTKEIGNKFRFNVKFMNWMKANVGSTFEDAVNEWNKIDANNKINTSPKEIAPQFEYNTYIRDFIKDNPKKTRQEAIKYWKLKRDKRGSNKYEVSDLSLNNL